jgi:hypothetical protein
MNAALQSRLRTLRAIRHKAGEALDDVSYRDILQRCAGVGSSTQIRSVATAEAVIDEFRRLGIGAPPPRPRLTPMQKKMWALWQQLADRGLVKNRRMSGLQAFIQRQTGVEAKGGLAWMNWPQEQSVVESLKRWLARGENPFAEDKSDA